MPKFIASLARCEITVRLKMPPSLRARYARPSTSISITAGAHPRRRFTIARPAPIRPVRRPPTLDLLPIHAHKFHTSLCPQPSAPPSPVNAISAPPPAPLSPPICSLQIPFPPSLPPLHRRRFDRQSLDDSSSKANDFSRQRKPTHVPIGIKTHPSQCCMLFEMVSIRKGDGDFLRRKGAGARNRMYVEESLGSGQGRAWIRLLLSVPNASVPR